MSKETIHEYTVGYTTYEGKRRVRVVVKATEHRTAVKQVEDMIRAAGDTPKSIGPATEHGLPTKALVKPTCGECGSPVAAYAKRCPHCLTLIGAR